MAIDSTIAGADAESYLGTADADALAAVDFGPEREWWLDAGLADKELALKRATDELDDWLQTGWPRYSTTQALLFPRLIDYSGTPAVAFIPPKVGRATYYQAAFLMRNARVLAAADTRRARGAQSVSEPNMSYTQRAEGEPTVLSSRAMHALEGFRRAGGQRALRSVRVSSGYVL